MRLHRSILGPILVLLLTAQAGCAGQRVAPPPVPSRAAVDSLGSVAVRWVDTEPDVKVYSTHTAGSGAAKGAATGAQAGLPLMAMGRVPLMGTAMVGVAGIGVSLAGALIGAPIGAIVGATKAPPRAAVREIAGTVAGYAAPLDIGGCVAGRVHQTLRRATSTWSVLVPASPPTGDAIGERALTFREADTVLDLGRLTLEVSGPFGIHPDGGVIVTLPVRVLRVKDGAELLSHVFRWAGAGSWPTDAAAFGEVMDTACRSLARDVALAVGGASEPREPVSEPDDRLIVAARE